MYNDGITIGKRKERRGRGAGQGLTANNVASIITWSHHGLFHIRQTHYIIEEHLILQAWIAGDQQQSWSLADDLPRRPCPKKSVSLFQLSLLHTSWTKSLSFFCLLCFSVPGFSWSGSGCGKLWCNTCPSHPHDTRPHPPGAQDIPRTKSEWLSLWYLILGENKVLTRHLLMSLYRIHSNYRASWLYCSLWLSN